GKGEGARATRHGPGDRRPRDDPPRRHHALRDPKSLPVARYHRQLDGSESPAGVHDPQPARRADLLRPPTNRFLCVAVKSSEGVGVWDTATVVLNPDARRFAMQRGGLFRDAIHIPEDAASRPGHYYARVGICDVDDYDITAEFDVR